MAKNHGNVKTDSGYNFAFIATSDDAIRASKISRYGKHALMFQSSGVKLYHEGDNEEQVIFYGPYVHEVVPIFNHGTYQLHNTKNSNILLQDDSIEVIIRWVMKNFNQYRSIITRTIK